MVFANLELADLNRLFFRFHVTFYSYLRVVILNVSTYIYNVKIEEAIKTRKIEDPAIRTVINIDYTASWLSGIRNEILGPLDFTIQQFNILRILRGQYPNAVTVKFLIERMVDKNSNASRLVDKLYLKKLIDRNQCDKDRRQVDVKINEKGLEITETLSTALESIRSNYENLTNEEFEQLSNLLDKLRG